MHLIALSRSELEQLQQDKRRGVGSLIGMCELFVKRHQLVVVGTF